MTEVYRVDRIKYIETRYQGIKLIEMNGLRNKILHGHSELAEN